MSSGSVRSRGRRLATGLAWLLLAALLVRAGVARAGELLTANHDVAWFLHAGAVWLDGGEIGVDVIDTNPPLVVWLAGGEVALARLAGWTPLVLHAVLTALLALLALFLAGPALARLGFGTAARSALGLFLAVFASIAAGYESGQREHWLVFLLLPYAAWALVPGSGSATRVVAGLGLALGVALKPHYVAAVLALEGLRLVEQRSWRALLRAELVVAALAVPFYVVAIQLTAPSYWGDARDTLAVYAAYDRPVPLASVHTLLAGLALAAGVLAAWRGPRTRVPLACALLALAGVLAAQLQRKNFAYHHLPTDVFAGAALASAALAFLAPRLKGARATLALEFVPAALALGALALQQPRTRDPELRSAQARVLAPLQDGEGCLVFTASVGATFPVANFTAGRSLSPYSCLWLIAGNYGEAELDAPAFPYRTLEAMHAVERRALERVVTVLRERRPRFLLFDVRPVRQAFGRSPFEFRRYFEAHPDFAPLVDGYRLLSRDGFFEYYERRG